MISSFFLKNKTKQPPTNKQKTSSGVCVPCSEQTKETQTGDLQPTELLVLLFLLLLPTFGLNCQDFIVQLQKFWKQIIVPAALQTVGNHISEAAWVSTNQDFKFFINHR